MNVITKFLENYSYRFPKGYPDMNNLEDKALLYEILAELNISEQDEVKPSSNELTSEDINLCNKYKFSYYIPDNLDNKSNMKDVNLKELDEEELEEDLEEELEEEYEEEYEEEEEFYEED